MFGYEGGAFTGAKKHGKKGLIELAHKGTLFLDEIGEMPVSVQAKLLRVLQEKEVLHVGGEELIPVDIRVIAATNRDLEECIKNKTFRPDLYYRLSTLILEIPPLSARPEDVPELIDYYTKYEPISEISKQIIRMFFVRYIETIIARKCQGITKYCGTSYYLSKIYFKRKHASKDLVKDLTVF